MCATAAPALLFILLVATLSLSIMCGNQLSAEGLPVRRERGADDYEDILAGNDFLSVFLESSLRRARKETTTVTEESINFSQEAIITEPYVRTSRQAGNYYYEVPQSTDSQLNSFNTSDSSSSDGVIIAVHVSSSVGSQINKNSGDRENILSESTTHMLDQNFLLSEEHPSIVAKSSKSELNVEEPSSITINNENNRDESTNINQEFQANIQNLPTSQHISFNPSGFLNSDNKENLPPFHHSLIYHDNPKEPGRARSVSYSTIIQAISPTNEKPSGNHERKERNYETGTGYRNSYESLEEKNKEGKSNSKIESNIYAPSSTTSSSRTSSWDNYQSQSSTTKTETTSKSWQKPYSPMPINQQLPKVYGRSEQNYEVDEAVSVDTNGRTHGIQNVQLDPTKKSKTDQEKDQKVGYVVEGRNYRKYRVEERTPDGFIVGEYGVVSHDDGSLRGVRYTADGTINPRLIYDALMKFLAL